MSESLGGQPKSINSTTDFLRVVNHALPKTGFFRRRPERIEDTPEYQLLFDAFEQKFREFTDRVHNFADSTFLEFKGPQVLAFLRRYETSQGPVYRLQVYDHGVREGSRYWVTTNGKKATAGVTDWETPPWGSAKMGTDIEIETGRREGFFPVNAARALAEDFAHLTPDEHVLFGTDGSLAQEFDQS